MRGLSKIFSSSSEKRKSSSASSRRGSAVPRPRLDRCNAIKDINYEYTDFSALAASCSSSPSASSCSLSSEALQARSIDLYEGKTSFRFDGVEGEFKILCETLGFSGIEDFTISPEEYATIKVKSHTIPAGISNQAVEDIISREIEGNCVNKFGSNCGFAGLHRVISVDSSDTLVINVNNEVSRGIEVNYGVDDRFVDAVAANEIILNDNSKYKSNKFLGNEGNGSKGIKGLRPPVLAPPPMMSLHEIDNESSTWDLLRGFCLEGDNTIRIPRYGQEFCKDEEAAELIRKVVMTDETFLISGSSSLTTTTSVDDDCSSTTITPLSSVSPSEGFGRVIMEWQKGDLLGRGSFGSVYEGIADDGFFFAVKEVSLLDQGDEAKQCILQLEQEIALLSQFEHENIVQYYGTKKDESHLYIFLELVTKGSLLSLYQKYTLKDTQVSAYTRQILRGLKYLHDRNVIHRDIKCANILVDTSGLVKLADFGLARATKLNDVKSCKGTVLWMAPEVVRSHGYGLAADIWSLGCTVLEMLTRRFPYSNTEEPMAAMFKIGRGERPPIPNSLSSDACDFILQCLQIDPSLRPTASQLLDHPFVQRPLPSFSSFPSPHYLYRQT